jgi:hypothetical protein
MGLMFVFLGTYALYHKYPELSRQENPHDPPIAQFSAAAI